MSLSNLTFRRYNIKDLHRCGELIEDAWLVEIRSFFGKDKLKGRETYVKLSLLESNWMELACDSQKIVGLLFGSINKPHSIVEFIKILFSSLAFIAQAVLGGSKKSLRLHKFLYNLLLEEIKIKINRPASNTEIELFIVDSRYRGRGIGRLLLDRFINAARNANIRIITVFTEDKACNWQFYEKYGFKKAATFYSNFTSYLIEESATGIIYTLELE